MKFILTYTNGKIYKGASFQGDWKVAPKLPMAKLEFIFGNTYVCLKGYKEYNHLYQRHAFGVSFVSALYLMGRTEDYTKVIMYDFVKKQIFQKHTQIGKEYNNEVLSGWKEGNLDQPNSEIRRKE